MKVLWITNIVLPEAQSLMKGIGVIKSSGGWLEGAANMLSNQNNVDLFVASVSADVNQLTRLEGKNILYYLLPLGKGYTHVNHDYEPMWRSIRDSVKPDIIHLHGTEYTHGLAYIEACGSVNVCVSIQGLLSAYYPYYYSGLSKCEILSAPTLLSLLRGGILSGYRDFKKRSKYEIEILQKVKYILGRTSWDRERTWAINPNATYFYSGETLRSAFYTDIRWDYNKCRPHSIFLSQANYSIKGLHMVLKAMPLVLRHYPDAILRIAGFDICRSKGGKELLKISDYGLIIRRMINKMHLNDKVSFTGLLDAEEMRDEYLSSNVFVCPSSIENSPNSLGEAQILGVPVIASYVGGTSDMMKGNEDNLYRFEEIEMLAYKIMRIFDKRSNIDTECMRQIALQRHDPQKNVSELLDIYNNIIRQNG